MSRKVGKPRKYKDVVQLQKVIDEYFVQCDTDKEPYTITGLALALDINRSTLLRYETEFEEEYRNTIKKAKTRVENNIEKNALMGKYNPTIAIFNLKNNFGWKDKQEIEQNIKADVETMTLTPQEKEKKLKDLKERLDDIYEDD